MSGEQSNFFYKLALKEATKTCDKKKSQGVSLNYLYRELNNRFELDSCKISKQTLYKYIKKGKINESPLKRGLPPKIPTFF